MMLHEQVKEILLRNLEGKKEDKYEKVTKAMKIDG